MAQLRDACPAPTGIPIGWDESTDRFAVISEYCAASDHVAMEAVGVQGLCQRNHDPDDRHQHSGCSRKHCRVIFATESTATSDVYILVDDRNRLRLLTED